MYLETRR